MTHRFRVSRHPGMAGLAIILGIAATSAFAAGNDFKQCLHLFANGHPPIIRQQEEPQPRALCFSSFAILHSGRSRTPIFVAEKLNKQVLLDARNNRRTDGFHEEARLPAADRAKLEDCKKLGF